MRLCAEDVALSSEKSSGQRFTLSGPSVKLDPTRHAFRADVADIALAGQVTASHYAEPLTRTCISDAHLRPTPDADAGETLLAGEPFAVLDCSLGLAWGYRVADHLVGYVDAASLGDT